MKTDKFSFCFKLVDSSSDQVTETQEGASFVIDHNIMIQISEIVRENSLTYDNFLLGCFFILMAKITNNDIISVYVTRNDSKSECYEININHADNMLVFFAQLATIRSDSAVINQEVEMGSNKKIRFICFYNNEKIVFECLYKEINLSDKFNTYMANRFKALLDNIEKTKSTTFEDLSILPAEEQKEIINIYTCGKKTDIDERCFHQLFEEQVVTVPENIAVEYKGLNLTYYELNEKANQLARYLIEVVSEKEALIGICMERSIEFLISILGILKAGFAYIPLDPDTLNPGRSGLPQKRLQFMLKDTDVKVLISKKSIIDKVPETKARILCLDDEWDTRITLYDKSNLNKSIDNRNLAYGIYTSGSTGKPKAVLIEHRSIINLFSNLKEYVFKNNERLILSLNAPLGFDASVQQLTGLLAGYCISIIPEGVRNSGKVLLQHLKKQNVQVFDCTPSQLQLLLEDGMLESGIIDVTDILVGGEPISQKMWSQIINSNTQIRFFNVYGPTECTVDTTIYPISREYSEVPLIGRPFNNCDVFVLDSKMRIVPIGVPGELFIAGYGLGRGYLNREELTNSKYLPHPFSMNNNELIYRTGDIGLFTFDGNIKYLSRTDNQIKIRSHRIELGEIESVLKQHPSVKDAVAIIDTKTRIKKIVVYIILNNVEKPGIEEYVKFLEEYLPIYMLPANYVFVDSWPLKQNGKIDYGRLPPVSKERPMLQTEYIEPTNNIQLSIAGFFEEILNIDRVGIHDDFVSLGGDSMTGISILTKIYKTYDCDIDFNDFFENPCVANVERIINIMK